jgi:hypothetical protein
MLLLLTVVATPVRSEGLLLCICADGHISLELSCDTSECCADDQSFVVLSPNAMGAVAMPAPVTHCTDIPLLAASEPALRQKGAEKSTSRITAPIDPACVSAKLLRVDESHSRPAVAPVVIPSYSPASQLRTIALLI